MRAPLSALATGLVVAGTLALPTRAARAQSLLDRPDNISSDWIGNTGTVYFNFLHRFSTSPPPERKVSNFPTFLIATGIASRGLVGLNYATNSVLVPRYPNEFEFFARYAPWQQDDGAPLDVGGQVDYNLSVRGVDGELSVARREGPVRLIAVGRVLADTIKGGTTHFAVGGGGTIRLVRYVALAGDVATMTSQGSGDRVVWSAGVRVALPNTPHTLSIHVSNANTATLQGLSRGGGTRRYGFEFTIPITLSRFFHPDAAVPPAGAPSAAVPAAAAPTAVAPTAVAPTAAAPTTVAPAVEVLDTARTRSRMTDSVTAAMDASTSVPSASTTASAADRAVPVQPPRVVASPARAPAPPRKSAEPKVVNVRIKGLSYIPSRTEIATGTTVQWKNYDPLQHTVTATDKSFTSPTFGLEETWRHTFTKPGIYAVYCTLHPDMKATVVVK